MVALQKADTNLDEVVNDVNNGAGIAQWLERRTRD